MTARGARRASRAIRCSRTVLPSLRAAMRLHLIYGAVGRRVQFKVLKFVSRVRRRLSDVSVAANHFLANYPRQFPLGFGGVVPLVGRMPWPLARAKWPDASLRFWTGHIDRPREQPKDIAIPRPNLHIGATSAIMAPCLVCRSKTCQTTPIGSCVSARHARTSRCRSISEAVSSQMRINRRWKRSLTVPRHARAARCRSGQL